MTRRVRVGLTGGIASGKTAVSDLLQAHGAVIIDSDVLAREVVAPGSPGLGQVVQRFGRDILHQADGSLDRAALGKIVFADPAARQDLEKIIHPAVRSRAAELEAAAPVDAVVVQVIPLLVETGQSDHFDVLVVVDVDPTLQLRRVMERGGLSEDEASSRIAAQASRDERLAVADVVIKNSGTRADLAARVDEVWQSLAR